MIIKDGKKYYTLEEAIELTEEDIKKDAKDFAKKVLKKIRENKDKEKLDIKEDELCIA